MILILIETGMVEMTVLIVIVVLIVVVGIWVMGTYNGLVKLKNLKEEGWSGIDVQLKRRFDLVPNLVETVKGYASHERETLENVMKARAAVSQSNDDPAVRMQAENQLTGALRHLIAVAENYPQLKANENFLQLQGQLSTLEDDIQSARKYYNGTVRNYNTSIQHFPAVLIARKMGFAESPFFEAAADEKAAPKFSFDSAGGNSAETPVQPPTGTSGGTATKDQTRIGF